MRAAREFAALAPEGATPAQAALAWIVAANAASNGAILDLIVRSTPYPLT